MNSLESKRVRVFPSAYRGKPNGHNDQIYDPESRFNTEANIVGLINRLTSRDSFVIGDLVSNKLTCSIHGYLFELDFTGYDFASANNVWAHIVLKDKNTTYDPSTNIEYAAASLSPIANNVDTLDEYNSTDNKDYFIGLILSDSEPTTYPYRLKILVKDGATYKVPDSSKFALDSTAIANGSSETDESIDDHFTTTSITVTGIGTNDQSKDFLVRVDADGLLSSKNAEQNLDITADTNANLNVCSGLSKNSEGDITLKTKTLRHASTTQSGIVSTGIQVFAGRKTFNDGLVSNEDVTIRDSGFGFQIDDDNDDTTTTYQDTAIKVDYSTGGAVYSTSFNLPYSTSSNSTETLATQSFVQSGYIPVTGSFNIQGSLTPGSSASYSLGSSSNRWNYVYGTIIDASNYFNASDRRLKENIEDFKYEKSILDIPVKRFDYINGEKNQIGIIAQDLQELYPELVKENKEGYLSIQESKLVYLLMEEVKELKAEVKKLKGE